MECLFRFDGLELAGHQVSLEGVVQPDSFLVLQSTTGLNALFIGVEADRLKLNNQTETGWGAERTVPLSRADGTLSLELAFGRGGVEIREAGRPLLLFPLDPAQEISSLWGVGAWQSPALTDTGVRRDFRNAWSACTWSTGVAAETAVVIAGEASLVSEWALGRYARVAVVIGDEADRAEVARRQNAALASGRLTIVAADAGPTDLTALAGRIGPVTALIADAGGALPSAVPAGTDQLMVEPLGGGLFGEQPGWLCLISPSGAAGAWLPLSRAGASRVMTAWRGQGSAMRGLVIVGEAAAAA